MTYAQGSDIVAADYNNFVNGTNQLNTVWATGTGDAGYGQTAISAVASPNDIAAIDWATLINRLNSSLTHQSGSGSGISAVVAGNDVNYLSTLATNINTAYTNRGLFATQGTTVTGTNFVNYANAATAVAYTGYVFTRTVTFASGDAARYFFNAGGQLNLVLSTTIPVASTRSTAVSTLIGTNIGGITAFRNKTNGGRTGTGGTATVTFTGGYRNLTTAYQQPVTVTSTTVSYTTDVANVMVKSNGVQGANGDLGTVITFAVGLSAPAHTWNATLNVGVNNRIDIVPPETTNLSNSWGTITIA